MQRLLRFDCPSISFQQGERPVLWAFILNANSETSPGHDSDFSQSVCTTLERPKGESRLRVSPLAGCLYSCLLAMMQHMQLIAPAHRQSFAKAGAAHFNIIEQKPRV